MLQKLNDKNLDIKVWVGDSLYNRNEASVSVFDSVVQGGDAVWEGLRIYKNGAFCLDRHLDRLYHSAHALAFQDVPDRKFIKKALYKTLEANKMYHDTHVRITLTRGEKITSGMDPRLNQSGPTLIILAEWKKPVYDNENGIRVTSSSIQRNSPRHLDSKIHHNNLLNNILAKIQANHAGTDAALMLDAYGFVAELNGTNIFIVKDNKVLTPTADACLNGITRGLVIEACSDLNIQCSERNISLSECFSADAAFATGTMGEISPIIEIDGRKMSRNADSIMDQIHSQFQEYIGDYSTPLSELK